MEAYLDNSATTRCSEGAAQLMMEVLRKDYGNPSSLHTRGMEAEQYVKEARSEISQTLKVRDKDICFTSGGTESNNLAILGAAEANRRSGRHVITTDVEHPSVSNPFSWLRENGYEVTYLSVDAFGEISTEELRRAIRDDTILVSVMHVNNEMGAVEPVEEAAKIIKSVNPRTLFHVDAVQSYGKFRIYPKRTGIDLLSASGHKIHGPKGSGFLYVGDKVKIRPILHGGGQEFGLRSGTENVPAIAGLGFAAKESYEDLEAKTEKLYRLRASFIEKVSGIAGVTINGRTDKKGAPHIVSLSVDEVRSEVLLHALEERGIFISAGSACSSNKPAPSKTLQAIGISRELLDKTVRFSFSTETTEEEIAYAADALRELIPALSRFIRR